MFWRGKVIMAGYKAGDVIRLTRMAIGMTQEKLSENICTVETLSRIENGKHSVKKDTYERLMAKMEKNSERSYCLCTSKDMEILQERILIEDAIAEADYETAKEYLDLLKRKIKDSTLNRQYIQRQELNIAYRTNSITADVYLDGVVQLLEMTVPNYSYYLENAMVYPFTSQEMFLLLSLNAGYFEKKKYEECEKIYNVFMACLNADYMDEENTIYFRVAAEYNHTLLLKVQNSNETVEKLERLLKEVIMNDYGRMVPIILSEIATSYGISYLTKNISDSSVERKKPLLLQSYYIACARNDEAQAKKINDYIHNNMI